MRLGRLHAMARRPLPPAALVELGRAARAHLRLDEASAFARRALERDALYRPAVSLLVRLAVARGDLDAALGPLDRWRQLQPFDLAATQRRAELLRAHGRLDRALATVAAARRIRPDDPEWMELEGHILLELGRADEAIARFEQALRIDAQRPALRRYLELLRTEARRFEDDWRLPLEPALAAADNIPLDPTVAVRVLLDHHVIRVGRDGRRSHFRQQVLRIENDDGLQRLDRVAVPYAVGEQEVRFDKAWIVKPDGRRLRAPIRSQTHRASRRSRDEEPRTSRFTVDLPPAEVGDRVVLEYRVDDTATSFFGDYFGHRHTFDGPDPVLRSRLVLLTPRGRTIHTHVRPGSIRCQSSVSPDGKWDVRIWEQRDLARIEPEPDMPPVREIGRSVEISTFRDWNDFARWYWNLIRKQYVISPELHAKVQELTRGLSSREERIAAIYAFVAQKIRYNDKWEFGVHGFKPYKASSIFARRFGDCKDKALLINTMLSDLGIPSYPVLIRAERRRAHDDLALPMVEHFNHCIAFVPGPGPHGQDGWFLDGTAQYHAPTSLPGMDAGARVVVIGPEGAELRRVPVPVPLRDNGLRESRRLELAPDRSAEMTVELRASGDAAATLREMLAQPGQRAERLRRLYGEVAPGAEVLEVRTSPLSDLRQPVRIHYRLRIPHALEPGGEDLVLKSLGNPLGRWLYAERLGSFATSRTRRHDVLLPPPFGVQEEIEVRLPPGLAVQTLPADRTLHCPEGRYERRSRLRDGVVHMQRRLEIGAQRVPTADYPRWRRFAVDVDRADAERLRLQREETRD
ncbi:MAG: DUF3857 domain-containing protein [Planctomycetota bacterium]|nr:MAG: DUF3857 domain-containing protein [Planctomycetota bacterium]